MLTYWLTRSLTHPLTTLQWNFVMHPVYAAKACDPEGDYVRNWLPQLARLPVEYIHCPWEAPFGLRASARLTLCVDRPGQRGNYPVRVVENLEANPVPHLSPFTLTFHPNPSPNPNPSPSPNPNPNPNQVR